MLASYLFPHGERQIDQWIATGVSLGGNVTWRLLQHEHRITIAIPIIGLPFECFATYLGARATSLGIPFSPPTYPPSLRPLLESPPLPGCYRHKHVLSIHGEQDNLVPYKQGSQKIQEIRDEVRRNGGEVEVWVQPGVGHVVSVEMVKKTGEWVYKLALSQDSSSSSMKTHQTQIISPVVEKTKL